MGAAPGQDLFHSKRVWAATGFTSNNSGESETMALVRWATPESLRVYARMNLLYQARRRDMLLGANIDALNASARAALPQIDPDESDVADTEQLAEFAAQLDSAP